MENMKLPLALVAAMAVQLAGAVWWVSQQAATISSLEENVEQFASRMAVENTVNLKRDVQESKTDIAELWEDSDEVWEEMAAMLASFSSINDLKQRGMLDDTLVVFAGEFGRTTYGQGKLARDNYGRDHHPKCFSTWMAGGGIKGGTSYGETDDYSYNVVKDEVPVRDFSATILHQLGIDHDRLTFPFMGLDQKLTGVNPAKVVRGILS